MVEVEQVKTQEPPVKAEKTLNKRKASQKAAVKGEKFTAEEGWNIKFVGVRELTNGQKEDMEPPTGVIPNGDSPIKLPSREKQLGGFYHEDAAKIARMYPHLYKLNMSVDQLAKIPAGKRKGKKK